MCLSIFLHLFPSRNITFLPSPQCDITECVSTFPAFAQLKNVSGVESINTVAVDDTEETGGHTITAAGGATQVTSDGIYTADVTGSGTATDGGNYGGGVAGNMFDGNMSSKFSFASSILPNWWKYDFGSGNSETVNRLVIYGADTNNQTMTDWTFSGSNNDSDWTLLDTQSLGGAGSWPSNTTKTFSFTNTTAYRYYKMDITANTGGTVWLEIRDVQMLELTTAVSPKYGTAMGKFEGTESANWDCVTVPDHADWRLGADGDGTGVFTIECWHYKTQTGTTDTMFAHGNDANDYWTFLTTGTALIFKKTVSSSETTIKSENTNGGSNIAINQWYHFKLTRDSSDNLHMYLNLSLIHISEPTRRYAISYAVFC